MYNQGFLDDSVLVLKKDGVQEYLPLGSEGKLGEVTEEAVLQTLGRRYLYRPEGGAGHFAGVLPSGGAVQADLPGYTRFESFGDVDPLRVGGWAFLIVFCASGIAVVMLFIAGVIR